MSTATPWSKPELPGVVRDALGNIGQAVDLPLGGVMVASLWAEAQAAPRTVWAEQAVPQTVYSENSVAATTWEKVAPPALQ